MRILFITGDEYSAMNVDQEFGFKKAAQMTEENGGKLIIDNDEMYAELKILEFGDVDINFVHFISDKFIDYDYSKGTDFYIIEN